MAYNVCVHTASENWKKKNYPLNLNCNNVYLGISGKEFLEKPTNHPTHSMINKHQLLKLYQIMAEVFSVMIRSSSHELAYIYPTNI